MHGENYDYSSQMGNFNFSLSLNTLGKMSKQPLLFLIGFSLCLVYSCCNDKDVFHELPGDTGRYYDKNDTVVFYSSETETYDTFLVCSRHDGFFGDEFRGTYCSWVEYFHRKWYELCLDSCGTERIFDINFERIAKGSDIYVRSYYENDEYRDRAHLWTDTAQVLSQSINGFTYNDVYPCSFYANILNDSLKSGLISMEYGIIQYSFENSTYSLLNPER
jgi:hypothetical protein